MKNKKNQYTTIQVSKEINQHIRAFCDKHGLISSTLTEQHWVRYISASMSGSISLQG